MAIVINDVNDSINSRELGRQVRSWGRWGSDGEKGTTNLIDQDHVRNAAALVKSGRIFDLGIALVGTYRTFQPRIVFQGLVGANSSVRGRRALSAKPAVWAYWVILKIVENSSSAIN